MIQVTLSEQAAVLSTKIDGHNYSRPVDYANLIEILETGSSFDSDLLPANTRYFTKKGEEYGVVIEFPPMKRTVLVKYEDRPAITEIQNVPLPGGILIARLYKSNGVFRKSDAKMWAVSRNGLRSQEDTLYRYPTSNMRADGRICWGKNFIPDMKKIAAVEGVAGTFFASYFNNHWADSMVNQDALGFQVQAGTIENYFSELANRGEFLDEWLLKAGLDFKHALELVCGSLIKRD